MEILCIAPSCFPGNQAADGWFSEHSATAFGGVGNSLLLRPLMMIRK
uniref:Uncharacterized protein n=1 Tax=Utricularia reniformis TaxID=192314 RepID=A0A1Y0B1I4_9LAMI|nr:hypothetical protein AEK19_MT1022 [Utricularia reniformis]ART31244.1 hypothetical protein AEK19_MT1022 [Utricularia reniformis]